MQIVTLLTKENPWLPIIKAASANQNLTNNNPCENPKDWLPCFLTSWSIATEWMTVWLQTQPSKYVTGAHSLMTRDVSCNQMRQTNFTSTLASDSSHHAFHLWTHFHMAAGSKACEDVTQGGGSQSSVLNLSEERHTCQCHTHTHKKSSFPAHTSMSM